MNAITYYYGDTYESKEYISNLHTIGNYSFKFSKTPINNNNIFELEIFTIDGVKITDFKMDLETTKLIFKFLYCLAYGSTNFHYELPLYNMMEAASISGEYTAPISNYDFQLKIYKTHYDNSKTIKVIPFKDLGEIDAFVDMYFFHLLIDMVDDKFDDEMVDWI